MELGEYSGFVSGVSHGLRRQLDREALDGAFGQVYQLMVNGVVTWKRNYEKLGVTYNNCHHLALPISPEDSEAGETAID